MNEPVYENALPGVRWTDSLFISQAAWRLGMGPFQFYPDVVECRKRIVDSKEGKEDIELLRKVLGMLHEYGPNKVPWREATINELFAMEFVLKVHSDSLFAAAELAELPRDSSRAIDSRKKSLELRREVIEALCSHKDFSTLCFKMDGDPKKHVRFGPKDPKPGWKIISPVGSVSDFARLKIKALSGADRDDRKKSKEELGELEGLVSSSS